MTLKCIKSVTEPRGGLGGTYPPVFENMGLVISPNLQTRAYGACERHPVSPDFRVPPYLQTPGSVTASSVSNKTIDGIDRTDITPIVIGYFNKQYAEHLLCFCY